MIGFACRRAPRSKECLVGVFRGRQIVLGLLSAAVGVFSIACGFNQTFGQQPRFGRSYGIFGERILGQPIRPPQPRFSQGIERSPDGTFQGIRPPGSAGYPRSEATREAREFRAREWLTPSGNWDLGERTSAGPAMPEVLPPPPQPLGTNSPENQGLQEAAPEGLAPPAELSPEAPAAATPGMSEGEVGSASAGPTEGASLPNIPLEAPVPSRWVNSTRASGKQTSGQELSSRAKQLVPAENWREAIKGYLDEKARAWPISGKIWEEIVAQRIIRALPSEVVGPLRVSVREGIAVVEGKVRSEEAKSIAGRILLLEPGIWQVDNRLVVASP